MPARPRAVGLGVCLAAALIAVLLAPPAALASRTQVAILQDDPSMLNNASATLQQMRHIGVQMVRVSMRWSLIAPNASSHQRPRFNATNPDAYPSDSWSAYDTFVREAHARGIQVMFVPTGFAPLWAQGPNPGASGGKYDVYFAWKPSASEFGQFVRAAGTRYSGGFRPPGSRAPLPRVSTWELWNEPNFGEDLAPQAIKGSSVLYSPVMYRALVNAGWGGLRASGHGHDTILIGSLAGGTGADSRPRPGAPQGLPGTYGSTKSMEFIRELYCVKPTYKQYLGASAAIRGCPTTLAGYRRFRAQNPVLFNASGFSDHPYPVKGPPSTGDFRDPKLAQFNQLPNVARALDRIQRVYHSGTRLPIWNTEYGYITCPPTCSHKPRYVSPDTAAVYLNWAEYLSWRNPRIATTMQYLLYDPNPTVGTPEYGGFASGLIYYPTVLGGTPKPSFEAYRLPIFLPSASAGRGRTLEVWGCVRPAPFARLDTGQTQYAQIQFAPGASRSWQTLKTLAVNDPRGYIDVRVALPSTGRVRIAYTYPPLDAGLGSPPAGGYTEPLIPPITSRAVKVNIG